MNPEREIVIRNYFTRWNDGHTDWKLDPFAQELFDEINMLREKITRLLKIGTQNLYTEQEYKNDLHEWTKALREDETG